MAKGRGIGEQFMGSLIERAKRRFENTTPSTEIKKWWEAIDCICSASVACAAEILDEMSVRFPLNLVIPGVPDNNHFKTTGRIGLATNLFAGGTPQTNRISFTAPKNRTLVITKVELTPEQDNPFFPPEIECEVQCEVRGHRENFKYIVGDSEPVPYGPFGGVDNTFTIYNRVILSDEEQFTLIFINNGTTSEHYFDILVEGWVV